MSVLCQLAASHCCGGAPDRSPAHLTAVRGGGSEAPFCSVTPTAQLQAGLRLAYPDILRGLVGGAGERVDRGHVGK